MKKSLPVVLICALLLLWEACVRMLHIPLYVLPAPTQVITALIGDIPTLARHAFISLAEALLGMGISLVLALVLGVLMDAFPTFKRCVYPILVITQTVPMIVLAPIFIIYMGFGLAPKILTVTMMCFFPIAVSFADGMAEVDAGYVNLLRTYGASRLQLYTLAKMPASLPSLLSGLKVAATYSVSLTPDAGEMRVDGAPFTGVSGHFAYMPQSDLLFSWQTILENVCLYGRIHGRYREALEEAKPRFAEFGLAGCENLYPASLSGGMRQRAAFLRTSLCSADILLLDEPFGALDVISRGDMQEWLLSMRKRLSRTALLVTHDVDEAIYLSNRILILGGSPAHIVREFTITEPNRTREWLFDQGALRGEIYRCIKGEGA